MVFVVLGALVGAAQKFLDAAETVDEVLGCCAGLHVRGLDVGGVKVFVEHLQEFPDCHGAQGTGEVKSVCHSLSLDLMACASGR